MSVGIFNLYNTGKEALLADNANQINWASDTIVCALLDASYSPSAAHSTWNDAVARHVTGTNYAPVELTGKTSVLAAGKILWDCADIEFGTNVTVTAKYAVILKRAGGALATSDQLIGYVDLNTTSGGATASSTNSIFTVGTANGIFDV